MVIVHVNQTDDIQFLYECPASTDCHELAVRLSEILNEILKSSMLVKEVSNYINEPSNKRFLPFSSKPMLSRAANDLLTTFEPSKIQQKEFININEVNEKRLVLVDGLKLVFPDGVDNDEKLTEMMKDCFQETFSPVETMLMFGNKALADGKLEDYIGKNDKTTISVKLCKK